jgi:hypothetical protein
MQELQWVAKLAYAFRRSSQQCGVARQQQHPPLKNHCDSEGYMCSVCESKV